MDNMPKAGSWNLRTHWCIGTTCFCHEFWLYTSCSSTSLAVTVTVHWTLAYLIYLDNARTATAASMPLQCAVNYLDVLQHSTALVQS